MLITREEALAYHRDGRRGKIEIRCTKPTSTQRDLSLAYTPGVAEPCLEIKRDAELVDEYTARANLVAVVSNGTAVLGLGNIGPKAGKPVMEGKAVLFKRFADIDVFDIEIDAPDADDVIRFCEMLAPTVGGINLEDIKAPSASSSRRSSNAPAVSRSSTTTSMAPRSSPERPCSTRSRSPASGSTR